MRPTFTRASLIITRQNPYEWSDAFAEVPDVSPLRVLAQIDRTYVLATDGAAIVLIDQHAAHERIVFEQLRDNALRGATAEPLLVPHDFEVAPEQAERLDTALEALAAGGLVLESRSANAPTASPRRRRG